MAGDAHAGQGIRHLRQNGASNTHAPAKYRQVDCIEFIRYTGGRQCGANIGELHAPPNGQLDFALL